MQTKSFAIEKLYYSIGEVAELFDVNTSLIRFWEKEFPQLHPKKNSRGNRVYSKKDLELFKKIHHLVKEKGFTLEGAKNAMNTPIESEKSEIITDKLLKIRSHLISISSSL